MPAYPFLQRRTADLHNIADHLRTLKTLGVPYTDEMITSALEDAKAQASASGEAKTLLTRYGKNVTVRDYDGQPNMISELDALIAYLQRLGNMVDFTTYHPDMAEPVKAGGHP